MPQRFRGTGPRVSVGSMALDEIVGYYAKHYKLDKNLVYAVIKAESNGDRYAVSRSGACGLMQLMPGTAAEMGVHKIFDPSENIAGGTQYLAKLLKAFNNDTILALAAYNWGPARIDRFLRRGQPLPTEYVRRVMQSYTPAQRSS